MKFTNSSQSDESRGGQPLEGIKVLDTTHMLAGPYCSWVLAELGADVIKVERPPRGDFTRIIAPFANEQSVYFMSVNRGKRSITLDLKSEEGRGVFRELIQKADILIENNRAGVMERLGFDYNVASDINPQLIYLSISGFGQTGPYRHRAAFDLIVQALSGMMSITGEEDGPAARVGVSLGDLSASLFGAIGVLSALVKRTRTGLGDFVDISMLDCQLALLENAVARYSVTDEEPCRLGSRHPLIAPFQAFETTDQPLVVCVDTDDQWKRLCNAIEAEELLEDPRFSTGSLRCQNHAELEKYLQGAFSKSSRKEWLSILEDADVPCGSINSISEALKDPQVVARGMIVEVPEGSGLKFVRLPILMKHSEVDRRQPSPKFGEHTEEILEGLGLTATEKR